MRRITLLSCMLLLVLFGTVSAVRATQILYRSPEELGKESALVVTGTVQGSRSYWNADRTKIFTETVIGVDQSYKGEASGTVRIVQLGGVVDNVRMTVHGACSWRTGEEVLLFLDSRSDGRYRVAGFSLGKFELERDPATGRAFVKHPRVEGAQVLSAPGGSEAPGARNERMPLHAFINSTLGLR
jgi:hypothetical protein